MKDRKKRTLVIGILCCLLVFMGVGFAVMNVTLNIDGTATAINTWDVRMTKVEVIEKSDGTTNEEETKINEDGISANFKTDFTKPGDFITYKVTIENKGSIDAVLNDISVTLNVSESDKDLFNIIDTRPNNQLLEAGTSTTFTIKVEFRSDADRMPSGDIEYVVKVDYSQQDETTEGDSNETLEPTWDFKLDESGTIISYNYDLGIDVVIPATNYEGRNITNITEESFLYYNMVAYLNEDESGYVYVIYDEDNYETLKQMIIDLSIETNCKDSQSCIDMVTGWPYLKASEVQNIPADAGKYYVDVEKRTYGTPVLTVKTVDMQQAINLKTIGANSFKYSSAQKIKLEGVIFPLKGILQNIGSYAFYGNQLSSITIPSSVLTIGDDAFNNNPTLQSLTIKRVNSTGLILGNNWFDQALISEPTYDPS